MIGIDFCFEHRAFDQIAWMSAIGPSRTLPQRWAMSVMQEKSGRDAITADIPPVTHFGRLASTKFRPTRSSLYGGSRRQSAWMIHVKAWQRLAWSLIYKTHKLQKRDRLERLADMVQSRMTDQARAQEIAAYYDNETVARFYQNLWGGVDIHIGLYETGDETVAQASEAMTRHLLGLAGVRSSQRVLDIACGYGGTLRMLAKMGCQAHGLDISAVCVARANELNAAAGLSSAVQVVYGDFHEIDFENSSFDLVICQEAIIHSADRPRVFAEVYRVLRTGGIFAFSDIVTAEQAELEVVAAAFARLGASPGATPADYRAMAREAGFVIDVVEERPADIRRHYDKLAVGLNRLDPSQDPAMGQIQDSISCWQRALAGGQITWMCAVAHKPA